MTPKRRMGLLAAALAATLAAVAWVGDGEEAADTVVAPVVRETRAGGSATPRATAAGQNLDLALLDKRGLPETKTDLFTAKSWYVPPPPPPPPKPTAPELPFKAIGRLLDAEQPAVFLASGDKNRVIHVGDIVDNVWRVEAIEATRVRFIYLPLNEEKSLFLGAAS